MRNTFNVIYSQWQEHCLNVDRGGLSFLQHEDG